MQKRKIRNFLIDVHLQLKLPGVFVLFVMVMGVSSNFYVANRVESAISFLASSGELTPSGAEEADMLLGAVVKISVVFWTSTALAMIIVLIIVTHRIAGAQFALVKHIRENLINGADTKELRLRDGDFLTEIASAVNELAQSKLTADRTSKQPDPETQPSP